MRKSKLQIAQPRMVRFFRASQQRIWTRRQLTNVLLEMREEWDLAQRTSTEKFLEFLVNETDFIQTTLSFPYLFEFVERFWLGAPSIYELSMSLHSKGYFSHHTALYLHKLTKQEPDTTYFNIEQPSTGASKGRLYQKSIDAAFQWPSRVSNNRAEFNSKTICLLSGKNTANAGVIERKWPKHGMLRVTNIERTLIDCTVRPIYSGGPLIVSQAFNNAAGKFSVVAMAALLQKLNYIYPYNQVVGFYLDRIGKLTEAERGLFRQVITHDFYLDYQMDAPHYSPEWRLYYPAELDQ